MRCAATTLAALLLSACAAFAPQATPAIDFHVLQGSDVILLGEQHDGPEQETIQAQVITHLAQQGRLQALVLEMAVHPNTTQGLPPEANEAQVRSALHWTETAWPWTRYRAPVMAAVRAGVPVLGGNLPRHDMAAYMSRPSTLEQTHPAAWARLQVLVRSGHCDLLPEGQIPGMTRIQIAKDERMAQTLLRAASVAPAGKSVVLIAGAVHTNNRLGVPLHLPQRVRVRSVALQPQGNAAEAAGDFDVVWLTPAAPQTDHCASLRQQWSNAPRRSNTPR